MNKKLIILSLGLALATPPLGVFAQTQTPAPATPAAPPEEKAEEVLHMETFVTVGTRFTDRTVMQSPVPIDVISFKDVQTTGHTDINTMLQSQVPSFNFPRQTITDGGDAIRPATLRGLAPDQTLVLINGKRRHTTSLAVINGNYGRGSVAVDMNAIPSVMIERVEVLRDGAAAQYGSDAIAGVINIVLRKDHTAGVDGLWGVNKKGDGEQREVALYYGTPLGDAGKGSLFATFYDRERDKSNRAGLDTRQLYFGKDKVTGLPVLGSAGSLVGSGITPSQGDGYGDIGQPDPSFTLDPREATINRHTSRYGDGDLTDRGFFFNANHPMAQGDSNLEFYLFGGFNQRVSIASGYFRWPARIRTVRALYPDGFLPLINGRILDVSLGGGVKGKAHGWDWDLSTVAGRNAFEYIISNTNNTSLGTASPKRINAGTLGFIQWTTNLDLKNQYDVGLKNPLKVALGIEHRWEEFQIKAGEPASYVQGGVPVLDGPQAGATAPAGSQVFPGFRPSDAGTHQRSSNAGYLDLENQVTEKWEVTAAGRFEKYTDFGTSTTGKLATRFDVSSHFGLRGSVSTGFRAPHLAQSWNSATTTTLVNGALTDVGALPAASPVARLLGALPLRPEKSVNHSVGATWQQGAFSASIDYYSISLKDRIVVSSDFVSGAISTFLASHGFPNIAGGNFFTNAVDTRTEGVDLTAHYVVKPEGLGKLTVSLGYNHNKTRIKRLAPLPAQLIALGITQPILDIPWQVAMELGNPKDVGTLSFLHEFKKWTTSLHFVRYGEFAAVPDGDASGWIAARRAALLPGYKVSFTTNNDGSSDPAVIQTYAAKWITDLEFAYTYNKHLTLSAGANNLFDVYPERNIKSTSQWTGGDFYGIFPYPNISPYGMNGAFYYAKMAYKF